jgi:hypothetical protein
MYRKEQGKYQRYLGGRLPTVKTDWIARRYFQNSMQTQYVSLGMVRVNTGMEVILVAIHLVGV